MSIYDKASLVLIPSGTKTSKVYSQVPTNGDGDFTFSRSTAATRVNASENIEKETQNLLLQSNQFDTTWGTANSPTLTSGQSGYDGSSDAWLLSKPAASFVNINQDVSISGVFTYSVYLKAGTNSTAILRALGGTDNQFFIDLSNGTSTFASATIIDYVIEDVGSGWYRTSISVNDSGSVRFFIYPEAPFGNTTAGNIYIQDAQLEQGLVARDYIETTTTAIYGGITDNVPRLDYTDSSCPALLLEPQRTNICPNSEDVSNWYLTFATATPNDAISPEGVQNAAKIVTSSAGCDVKLTSIPVSPSTTYTASFYCKLTSGSGLQTRFYDNTNGANIEYYTYDSQIAVGEWKRVTRTFTTPAGCNNIQIWFLAASSSASVTAHYWGYQLEAGSYATSYIPTYGSAVTRNVGTAINNNNSNLPTGYPFSLFAEVDVVDTGSGYAITLLTASNSANYYTIEYFSNTWHITARPNGATTRIPSSPPVTSGTHKVLGIFTDTTLKLYRNGAEIASGSHSQTFNGNIDDLLIGQLRTAGDTGTRNPVRQALVFNQALTDQEAIDLTTL